MKRLVTTISILFISMFGFTHDCAWASTPISAEVLGQLPGILSVQISPDGSKILILKSIDGDIVIVTSSINQGASKENVISNDEGTYNWAIWVSKDRILASVRFVGHEDRSRSLRLKSQRRLVSMKWDGTDLIDPNRFRTRGISSSRFIRRQPQIQDRLIDILKDDPEHILVQMDIDKAGEPAVYKLNIITRKRTRVIKSRRSVDYWMTDQNHDVRYGEGFVELKGKRGVRHVAYYRKSLDDAWLTLFDYDETSEERPFYFEGFSREAKIIYITANDESGKRALYTYDVDQKRRINKIAGDDSYDIVDVAIDDDYELEYFSYYRERPEVVRYGERGKRLEQAINDFFPDQAVSVASQSKDKNKIILDVYSPTMPTSYYYMDINEKTVVPIGQAYRAVDRDLLSMKNPVTYQARDGVEIPAYLSLPKTSHKNDLPTIIMPHGGPMARDGWDFDYWTQYLTSRGYAVLQMNYRGSTGYGEEYRMMGYHEWGQKMLYDINDGTKWMIEQGYADPNKICIMGGSYGGYAALQTVVMGEVDYKCSVAFAPIAHLPGLMQSLKDATGYKSYKSYVQSEEWTLRDASPSFNIERINVPVLVFHGTKDMNVPINQSHGFRDRMQDANKDITYIEFKDGDHFLSNETHRVQFLKETGEFLDMHLQ